ncbi:small ribosomal subunit protein mS23 [Prorops nasuta]|uniref:small ribosomal subunit protein mS23 n=1 Tax=Prorops nasuta TaxID=863751 RepID=UPI0034CFA87C
MAQSRIERIGTIYTRVKNLMKSKALAKEDLPIWFPIYEAFPPKCEPSYGRREPDTPLKPIFYKEDIIRARFQKEFKTKALLISPDNLTPTLTETFIKAYQELEKKGVAESELYIKAVESCKQQHGSEIQENAKKKEEKPKTHKPQIKPFEFQDLFK